MSIEIIKKKIKNYELSEKNKYNIRIYLFLYNSAIM